MANQPKEVAHKKKNSSASSSKSSTKKSSKSTKKVKKEITKIAKKEVIVTPDKPDDVYWGYNVISSTKSLKNSLKLYYNL